MRRLGLILLFLAALSLVPVAVPADRTEAPQFKCTYFIYPKIRCESKYVWPVLPIWKVYYLDTEDVVDLEQGIVVFLTLPNDKFSWFEMCYGTDKCIGAYGGWFKGKLKFKRK